MNETLDFFLHKTAKMTFNAERDYVNLDVLKWWTPFWILHHVMY